MNGDIHERRTDVGTEISEKCTLLLKNVKEDAKQDVDMVLAIHPRHVVASMDSKI